MLTRRRTTIAATTLAALGATAAIATAANPAPPKIAFVANGRVPADALAAGPIAGQLGAPIYTTEQHSLSPEAASALKAYNPELVIVLGGPVAIDGSVVDGIEDATGLAETDADAPSGGVVRAAGENRFATATAVAGLLAEYDPAFVSAAGAVNADTLDGKDASDFLTTTDKVDADTVDGYDASSFVTTGQQCAPGNVVKGMEASGALTCVPDDVDGGDADTLDGNDSSDFLSATTNMVPTAVVNVDANGWVNTEHHHAPATGAPTASQRGDNSYAVSIPGVDFQFAYDVATCTPMNFAEYEVTTSSSGGDLIVNAWDSTGTKESSDFTCIIYDMDG